ncbi:MAG: GNAT family N-acetyltransferase [Paludibacteraceae bacterium]
MNPLIAYCGLDCARCEARTATLYNDDTLRQKVARQWSEWNHTHIPATSINCLGCRTEGVKCPYCDAMCPIRQCALRREVSHCGECPDQSDCRLLQEVHRNAPEAQANLLDTDYIIRPERPEDYHAAEHLTREAFWNLYRPGCQEHFVLHSFRSRPEYIPELAFVMEKGDELIGHIMFVRATLTEVGEDGSNKRCNDDKAIRQSASLPNAVATLGPISIAPAYQRKGYGLRLLQYALARARETGIGLVCMEGNIDFYKHAGFQVASRLGIHYHGEPIEDEVPYFLAQELIPGTLPLSTLNTKLSTLIYTPPQGYFAATDHPEAFAAYEATFPHKEKKVLPTQLFKE